MWGSGCANAGLLPWSADREWDAQLKDLWMLNGIFSASYMESCVCFIELNPETITLRPSGSSVSAEILYLLLSWRREAAAINKPVSAAAAVGIITWSGFIQLLFIDFFSCTKGYPQLKDERSVDHVMFIPFNADDQCLAKLLCLDWSYDHKSPDLSFSAVCGSEDTL